MSIKSSITIENTSEVNQKITFQYPKSTSGVKWKLPMPFIVKPGEKREVTITMSADPKRLTRKIQDGFLTILSKEKEIQIPYLFVLEEPDYPRVMGFDFGMGDDAKTYRYEVYLPGGAEEFGIALFDADTYRFIQFLDWKRNIGKGQIQETIPKDRLPMSGTYLVKVFARASGRRIGSSPFCKLKIVHEKNDRLINIVTGCMTFV